LNEPPRHYSASLSTLSVFPHRHLVLPVSAGCPLAS
jgi:hypothetical protein